MNARISAVRVSEAEDLPRGLEEALSRAARSGGSVIIPEEGRRREYAALLRSRARARSWVVRALAGAGWFFSLQVLTTLLGTSAGAPFVYAVVFCLIAAGVAGLVWAGRHSRVLAFRVRHGRMEIEVRLSFDNQGYLTRRFPSVTSDGDMVSAARVTAVVARFTDATEAFVVPGTPGEPGLVGGDPAAEATRAWRLVVARVHGQRQRALAAWRRADGVFDAFRDESGEVDVAAVRRAPGLAGLEREVRDAVLLAFGPELIERGYCPDTMRLFTRPWRGERLSAVPPRGCVFDLDTWHSPLSQCRFGHVGQFTVLGTESSPTEGEGFRWQDRVRLECCAPVGEHLCGQRWTERALG